MWIIIIILLIISILFIPYAASWLQNEIYRPAHWRMTEEEIEALKPSMKNWLSGLIIEGIILLGLGALVGLFWLLVQFVNMIS